MLLSNIKSFTNGWLIGNFEPSLLKTDKFEIAHHSCKKDFKGISHIHKVALEYNYILSGKLIASGKELKTGDIFIYEPFDVSDVIFLEDSELIVIKVPSAPDDKYEVA